MILPDCTVHRLPQHVRDGEGRLVENPEWLALRKGVLTASQFGMWLLKDTTATAQKAKESAICKLLAETAKLWEPEQRWTKEEMQRGLELEPDAVASFEAVTGLEIESVGFCRSNHGLFGCSPDGLIVGQNAGFEGKIPLPSTHIRYRRAGELPDEYRLQVHGCMAVTGADHWHFQSWNPKLAPLRLVIERDDFTEELFAGLKRFSADVEIALAEEREAWNRALAAGEGLLRKVEEKEAA